ncbi:hypothetical protein A3D01_04880 [Candidatus Woesebacteria bacterium RIFCSPHIGHO2_02_FULL_39_13]|uniref:Methyltransferase type 11 domain-containing protein n=1 Tax=Candidatus Woesebacteria bacterium RIFCSPHIGHO2_02_FULL_39_13 TaxID=1802505 RepID=A0A1F7Z001_9BACT|nr:MAG: hypothetical protein A2692_00200 [Candidatus Woesebacteria bacterium RIFCSPHIGHO2_01_FULL_39_95]OGM32881.1 MAG: hypothetical protein A3D01_04880 [Candidatus Woesebacteria bacterium RIFCSPHIGHO2_02_FULL_39_13]OGM74394.1 MAG: hypothetical protein A3H19_05190 [Candidatus Woesebacteria bacterium RIFCSPLOWO2_12_FULL_39_9]
MLLPFTYPWIIKKHFSDNKKILDVGCGDGTFMAKINFDKKYEVTGIDLFDPYLKKAGKTKAYEKVLKMDVRKLNLKDSSFDCVHASQVLEHLKEKEALSLIKKMEKIAESKVIIGAPNGHFHQDAYDKNDLQRHQSSWQIEDFQKLGYTCYGQALKFIYGENGLVHNKLAAIGLVRFFLFGLSYLLSPLAYIFPSLGAHIIAVKEI